MARRFTPADLTHRFHAAELTPPMTLRQYYAGIALATIAGRSDSTTEDDAIAAVLLADRTIAELQRTEGRDPDAI